jgi:hypothetical protein
VLRITQPDLIDKRCDELKSRVYKRKQGILGTPRPSLRGYQYGDWKVPYFEIKKISFYYGTSKYSFKIERLAKTYGSTKQTVYLCVRKYLQSSDSIQIQSILKNLLPAERSRINDTPY